MREIIKHTDDPQVANEAGASPKMRGSRATCKRSARNRYLFSSCLRTFHERHWHKSMKNLTLRTAIACTRVSTQRKASNEQ
jgi:hypothetical protein